MVRIRLSVLPLVLGILALLLLPSAAPAQTMDPQFPTANGTVWSIVRDGNVIYVGGEFTSLQPATGPAVTRHFLAAIDATTKLPTDWAPEPNNYVRSIAVGNGVVYAGGLFTTIGGQARNRIAALDPATGLATDWDPNASNTVYTILPDGPRVLVGGLFASIGGQSHSWISALDAVTGAATAWDAASNGGVRALLTSGGLLYVAGGFTQIGGQARIAIAALDPTTGLATAWNPGMGGTVAGLASSGNTIYAAGTFGMMAGQARVYLAAIDATTGAALPFDAHLTGGFGNASAVVVNGPTVYAGGHFGTGADLDPTGFELAALDAATGADLGWHPGFCMYCTVRSLDLSDNTLYVGGEFLEPVAHLAAFALDTPTPVLVSLLQAIAEPGRVRLEWQATGVTGAAKLYRRTETEDWARIATLAPSGEGLLAYDDADVVAGTRYGYRLGIDSGTAESLLGETWVDVPSLGFALAGLRPNPAPRDPVIAFTLPDDSPAVVEVLDVSGRRVFAREVGSLGAGSHVVSFATGRPLATGVYLVRLTRDGRSLAARGVVIR